MKNFSYLFKRVLKMNYGQMFQKINSIAKKTGKSRLFIFRDMQTCATRHGAGYMDYDLFEMYNLTEEQRKTYLTRGRNNQIVKMLNDRADFEFLHNKAAFNTRFSEYIKREWVLLQEKNEAEVLEFLRKNPVIIAKPLVGSCGKGVEKLTVAENGGPEGCYAYLKGIGVPYELEQVLVQHPEVSAVYPHAINTLRAVTINYKGQVHLISTCFRIGNHGKHVDNFNNGGMVAPVDEQTGIVKDSGIDKTKQLYEIHPMTGTAIKGFQFPQWEEAIEMVKKAATEVPEIGYIGWDVAFTVNGPCLVEGNDFPGHDVYQLPEHTPDKIGMMGRYSFLFEEK